MCRIHSGTVTMQVSSFELCLFAVFSKALAASFGRRAEGERSQVTSSQQDVCCVCRLRAELAKSRQLI